MIRELSTYINIAVYKEKEKSDKHEQQIFNILMPRFSTEREPVITSIENYITLRRK